MPGVGYRLPRPIVPPSGVPFPLGHLPRPLPSPKLSPPQPFAYTNPHPSPPLPISSSVGWNALPPRLRVLGRGETPNFRRYQLCLQFLVWLPII